MADCTVVVLAYNLENYILDCLDSIESQQSEFDIRILIHDDCSTDKTLQLINDFASRSRLDVEVVVPKENRYKNGMGFFYELLAGCTSKYVAILDGDDTWTDPTKLDRQINLLETNSDISISSHVFSIVNVDMSEVLGTWPNQEFRSPSSTYKELAQENFIGALTVVFRRDCLPLEIQGYEKLGTGDYGLWGLIAGKGRIGFIDRNMANYRQHDTQVFANRSNARKAAAILESKLFVANHSAGEVRENWIQAISKDILGESSKLIEQLRTDNFILTNELVRSTDLNVTLGIESEDLKLRVESLDSELQIRSNAMEAIYDSFSWRITRPVRKLATLFKKTLRR